MADAHWHLLSYDVRDDARRRRVQRHLDGHGERVQFSVYRVHATRRNLIRLRWELARLMDDEDSLLVIPLPDAVARRIQGMHRDDDWTAQAPASYAITGSASTPGTVPTTVG